MHNIQKIIMATAAITTLAIASCDKNVFDQEKYEQIIKYMSPVDSVDQRHTWSLTKNLIYVFTANTGINAVKVMVLNDNPLTASSAEVVTQSGISDGETIALSVSIPSVLNSLYAALVDSEGNYYVKAISTANRQVNFTGATRGKPSYTPLPQAYTYAFEENFPEPGDYDYNDLVLRISQQRTGKKQITLQVTIAAVGAERQLASAIRLVDYDFNDIDSVRTTTGESFNDGVPTGSYFAFKEKDLLLKGRNNEALINLCIDAHWAMAFNVRTEYGLFNRKKYNVSTSIDDDFQIRSTRTLSYIISFKEEARLNNFTLDQLDPFIIAEYNGSMIETHLPSFTNQKVLYDYSTPTVKDLPWALEVPTSNFAYPLEGCEIGFRKRSVNGDEAVMFGAYMTAGHSFGEWVENYTQSLDWYRYPTQNQTW